MKVSREHYLRDDIWCGSAACTLCTGEGMVDHLALPMRLVMYCSTVVEREPAAI